ncbi:AAA family ATPase [Oribacterium sp. NK2B42]|uniref:AAA family ATPase n=1 Tax=Oribacterium sp. NK2B42 TaxID=689781 RepID=UPI000412DBBF|nr:AAA family ATPase [Oribacterium sp. NK2B42]
MPKVISIGAQYFSDLREKDCFYVDKTYFIKEWWEKKDIVTLITRPRRFGKTLNMSMTECFFSVKYRDRGDLFEGLSIWEDERYRALQGTYPVIFLSFAGVKAVNYETTRESINKLIVNLYDDYKYILEDDRFDEKDRRIFDEISMDMSDSTVYTSVNQLCKYLELYYGRKCIVIIDEYDTPMQEAWINGYWDELTAYMRGLFNNTFKTNPYLERGLMTGITRVSKESIFSDLNNLNVITTTSDEYADCFGFTEKEVFEAMNTQGIDPSEKEKVKTWYDGFTFGSITDIYNPWSVTSYLDKRKFDTYWANTSGNGLVGRLLKESDRGIKIEFEKLLEGKSIEARIDEQIVFDQLSGSKNAVWSLLLASGYLKVTRAVFSSAGKPDYQLALTNYEVKCMFESMIEGWFSQTDDFGDFISAMLRGDEYEMERYMNQVALNTFSSFDTGTSPSGEKHPERFYHGFVLGLMVDKSRDYIIKSNRESGYGRYDVVMEPKNTSNVAVIMEFKVRDERRGEKTLSDTAENALSQIEDRKYDADLISRGIPAERIYKYGFAFEGETCLIKKG